MQRIGLMGGSFNPIHCAHLNLARAALDCGCVSRVLFLPTGNPPHKHAGLVDKLDRLAMVQLAIEGEPCMGICREEIDREGVIYTVDTLTLLTQKNPDCRWVYLIGSDTLRVLHTWRRPEDVIRLCELMVVMRPGETQEEVQRLMDHWRSKGACMDVLPAKMMDISSTDIRTRIGQGLTLEGIVPESVENYIRAHGFYSEE